MDPVDAEIAVLIRKAIAHDEKQEREKRREAEEIAALLVLLNQ